MVVMGVVEVVKVGETPWDGRVEETGDGARALVGGDGADGADGADEPPV